MPLKVVPKADMAKTIFRHMVIFEMINESGKKFRGSGIAISKNLILTCAHNCYDEKKPFKRYKHIYCYPWIEGGFNKDIKVSKERFIPDEYDTFRYM